MLLSTLAFIFYISFFLPTQTFSWNCPKQRRSETMRRTSSRGLPFRSHNNYNVPPTTLSFTKAKTPQTQVLSAQCLLRRKYCEAVVATTKRKGFWAKLQNQRAFFDEIGTELKVKELSDWYRIPRSEVRARGGLQILRLHGGSLGLALKAVYPEYPWQMSRFSTKLSLPKGYWQNRDNMLRELDKAEQKLGIKQVEDWYSINTADLKELGFPSSFTKSNLVDLLSEKYPNHTWEKIYLLRGKYAQQKRLERAVASLFPDVEIKLNARKEAELINPETGAYLELDVYLPSLKLAFEYQDLHHYKSTQYAYQPLDTFQLRDEAKQKLAKEKDITLIPVPCWWDGGQESLVATVKKVAPNLLGNVAVKADAIPDTMPEGFLDKYKKYHVEDIGEPITACFMTGMNVDPTNWWVFEKYDGIRGFWNPLKKAFYSRFGRVLNLPQRIVDAMPTNLFLDGELWFGRDNFQEALKLSNRVPMNEIDWDKFKYMVFDVPNHVGTYEERYALLESQLGTKPYEVLQVAPKVLCKDMNHLDRMFQDILDQGGEGVILRDPTAPYETGRSRSFLKHKKFRDAEAKIVDLVGPSQWECILPNGIKFTAVPGTTEFVNKWNPQPGDIVSFKHRGFMLGSHRPISPTLFRLRPDLTWENVVNNFKEKTPNRTVAPLKRPRKSNRPQGHWSNVENWRKFFIEYAEKKGFDPFNPENWKNVTRKDIVANNGSAVLTPGLKTALTKAFPELSFTFPSISHTKGKEQWKEPQQCRNFFDKLAKDLKFDPLDVSAWERVSTEEILKRAGGYSLNLFNGGWKKALQKSYPELHFHDSWGIEGVKRMKMAKKEKNYWKDPVNCRSFFDDFAKDMAFNPLTTTSWYTVNLNTLESRRGGSSIRSHCGGWRKALQRAYPELDFQKWIEDASRGGSTLKAAGQQ